MTLLISVIVVTYNGWSMLERCLDALARQTRPPHQVIVVDNGSTDGTTTHLRAQFSWVTLIDAGQNLGFAEGNNRGIAQASGDIVVLINIETVADPDFLEHLVLPLERDQSLGATAATMVFSTAPDTVASAGVDIFENLVAIDRGLGLSRSDLPPEAPVFGPSAGAAAYRTVALEDVGRFPAAFFMYLEDVDLAWRLRLRGWGSVHVRDAIVHHDYSASAGEASPLKRRLMARNRLWVLARCVPGPVLRRRLTSVLRYELLAYGYGVWQRDRAMLSGRVAGLAGLRARLHERRAIQSSATARSEDLERWLRPEPSPREVLRLRRLTGHLAAGERPG